MLGADVVRYGIKPFVNPTCSDLTKKFGCKGPLSVFTDGQGNRMDCSWRCLSECKPSELMGLVTPPKTITFRHKDEHKTYKTNVTGYHTIFSAGETKVQITGTKDSDYVWFGDPGRYSREVSTESATKTLCQWFKKWTEEEKMIKIFAEMTLQPIDYPPRGSHIVAFDHPWIRPTKEWNIEYDQTRSFSNFRFYQNSTRILLDVQLRGRFAPPNPPHV